MKHCSTCKNSKRPEEFYWKVKDVKRSGVCKECHKAYRKEHYNSNRKKYIDKAKARTARVGKRYEKYRLTEDEWLVMLSKFDGKCWVCKAEPATEVDHNHECCPGPITCGDCVRGALCGGCNKGLGFFKDNVSVLNKAVEYLGY